MQAWSRTLAPLKSRASMNLQREADSKADEHGHAIDKEQGRALAQCPKKAGEAALAETVGGGAVSSWFRLPC